MKLDLRTMTLTAFSAALGFVLMMFEFALPFFPPFLRLDFSDLPALLLGFMLGPAAGLMVVGFRNLLHLTITATMGVGELANFLISGSFVLTASLLYSRWRKAPLVLGVGGFVMVGAAVVVNLYIIIPLYEAVLELPLEETVQTAGEINPAVDDLKTYLLLVIAPFNVIKATAVSAIFLPVYKRVQRISMFDKWVVK
ncbi:ECF transporter S component [Halarsenatibacter silvermanii]|uniref:Riboflavin transporter n=1 Tax=Halarsenatibacter silvermanii TaxID=321763 RepID=A0A1G9MC67_9FIRM|nr:ECF transporter S component [Halarsenatibacter silvermanii]SDL71591.1 Riboflavin transporter FmnP [Halarsenatibacter silvermanii]